MQKINDKTERPFDVWSTNLFVIVHSFPHPFDNRKCINVAEKNLLKFQNDWILENFKPNWLNKIEIKTIGTLSAITCRLGNVQKHRHPQKTFSWIFFLYFPLIAQ